MYFTAVSPSSSAASFEMNGTGGSALLELQRGGTKVLRFNCDGPTTYIRALNSSGGLSIGPGDNSFRIANNQTVLIGTATDSSNGILQLAASTVIGGGIGFGTDVSFYRTAVRTLEIGGNGTTILSLNNIGNAAHTITAFGGSMNLYGNSALTFQTGGSPTTALTLSSAQNATFAGTIGWASTDTLSGSASTDSIWTVGGNAVITLTRASSSANSLIITSGFSGFGTAPDGAYRAKFNGSIFASGGSVTTGAPNGGTAAAWKLGTLVTATVAPDTTRYIQLDVAGTLYKVIVST